MTLTTVNTTVFTRGLGPWFIYAVMTSGTGGIPLGTAVISDLQWLMNWMTGKAEGNLLSWHMRFMTLHARRNPAVFITMTCIASLLSMLAWELHQLAIGPTMAISAVCCKVVINYHIQRSMRILMAVKTGGKLITMRQSRVAGTALRHDGIIIILSGTIGVKLLMTVQTMELMPVPFLLYILKYTRMALTALSNGQRDWLSFIQGRTLKRSLLGACTHY